MTENNRVKISSIVESQLPFFVREDYPLVSELLTEYYKSLDSKSSCYDILQNIDEYVKVNNLTNLAIGTKTTSDVGFSDNTINVISTEGFPNTYGLLGINNEIILYKTKTKTSFDQCVRGFSGITEYSSGNSEQLTFSSSNIEEHSVDSEVLNLSSVFLKEFFNKLKKQFAFGFDGRETDPKINESLLFSHLKDFYKSKGTDRSFEILFRILYGKNVDVIIPSNYLLRPSSAKYRVTRNLVVEPIVGDIQTLKNQTIFQNQYENIPKSFGTVTDVRRLIRNEKEYYILMLDYDFDKDINVSGTIFGDLKVHPKTFITDLVSSGSVNITVDSTVGFPISGELVIREENEEIYIQYEDKTVNQFLNCRGISKDIVTGVAIYSNTYSFGYSSETNQEVRFRISGVLSDIDLPENTNLYYDDDIIKVLSLGYNENSFKDNNWIFNKSVRCKVKSLTFNGGSTYTIQTFDDCGIYNGDSVEIEYIDKKSGLKGTATIPKVNIPSGSIPGKEFQIEIYDYEISEVLTVKRLISKFSDTFVSDVLNVYKDFKEDILYIASSSLPSYGSDENQQVSDFSLNLNGTFSGEVLRIVDNSGDDEDKNKDHGFLTGDAIVYSLQDESLEYNRLSIEPGIYYVKIENEKEIRLSRSRSNIYNQKFISVASTTINLTDNINTFSLLKFSKKNNLPSKIDSQRLIRAIKNPITDERGYETTPGPVGILANGVELINYKSNDVIHYGGIKSIEVISGGKKYDIINPPFLNVPPEVSYGSSCLTHCWVEGSLERIDLLDGGFDYIETPIINITGGNGSGATAIAKMIGYDYSVSLNPTQSNSRIDLSLNQIGFSTSHKFGDGESVIYFANNNPIGGLSDGAKYYVKVVDEFRVNLHKNYEESIVGINSISLSSYGIGNHKFQSANRKLKVNSIVVTNSGSGYKTRKISVPSSGISTSKNTITTYNNPFNSGDIIYYYGGDQNILGLDTGRYIATRVDDSSFKVSGIGTGNLNFDFYYKTKQYVDFKDSGSGNHIFDYEPINVEIIGKSGISSITPNVKVSAEVNPVFRGEITSIYVYDGGVGYGSSEIVNYNKQPKYSLSTGQGAEIFPIISNGSIDSVVVKKSGEGYTSTPDILVKGVGVGALLVPIVLDGQIKEVRVINGGGNYDPNNTTIEVLSPSRGCEVKFFPQTWTLNLFNRLLKSKKILKNDSVVYESDNPEYGLQYTHLYAPRPLRKRLFSQRSENGTIKYKSDYQNDLDEVKYHSPIIGWAYDGNPIYGPYGYTSFSDKKIKQIQSGYSTPIDNQDNRPDRNIFPAGSFVEDYIFNKNSDLDEHNGRYCATPEFPNGTYAYFMTLESDVDISGTFGFAGDKIPKFPYVIGNTFKSKPIDFNVRKKYTQNEFIFDNENIIRNTFSNNTLSSNSTYEYFLNSEDLNSQDVKITNTERGSIDSVKIISGGEKYRVGDRVLFDNQNTGGDGASASVSHIKGKNIVSISQTSIFVGESELYPTGTGLNDLVGFTSVPHDLSSGEIIFIDSLSKYDSAINDQFDVKIKKNNLILSLGVPDSSVTGIVTYFYVTGTLDYPIIRENDILKIDSEEVKVLNIDKKTSRIRVLRGQNSTVSSAHSAYSTLQENPRKFTVSLRKPIIGKNYQYNKEIYFNPQESLGIGTISGIGHTIVFSNPGLDLSEITIPEKTIYIKDHGLNSGDVLIYRINDPDGVGITVSNNGNDTFTLNDNDILYTTRISDSLIGISTVKVSLGENGEFVGISQTGSTLYFNNSGIGSYHSFTTKLDNVLTGQITKNKITVSTGTTHSLMLNDQVRIVSSIGISTNIVLKYNDYHRRIVANPRDFNADDIVDNIITITNHGYSTGQKVIHTSDSPSSGLENEGIYYVVVFNKDQIRLSNSYYGSIRNLDESIIIIETPSYGTLSQINPKITVLKNQKLSFDLSDSSLSEMASQYTKKSSFKFSLFKDSNFYDKFEAVDSNGFSKIKSYGNIGIDSSAKIEIDIDDNFPSSIWYNLIPTSQLQVKNELFADTEVTDNNKISIVKSNLDGNKVLVGISSTTFTFNGKLDSGLKDNLINQLDGSFGYYTSSKNDKGGIEKIKITTGGIAYKNLPKIIGVDSDEGNGSILLPQSKSIGKINSYKILDIGYDYPSDITLKPYVKLPTTLRLEPLSTIDSIEVIFPGLNYTTPPDLVLIDEFTNKIIEDLNLKYDLNKRFVTIVSNSKAIYNLPPKVIATNNTNGLSIKSIEYDDSTKIVRALLKKEFSDQSTFPFSVGDDIFVEGVSVVPTLNQNIEQKGYNSKSYNYSMFKITKIQPAQGFGNAYIEYSLNDYLEQNQTAGTFDPENSSGIITPQKYLPRFNVTLRKNSFHIGEEVIGNEGSIGEVLRFDKNNEYIFVKSTTSFANETFIIGQSSKSQAAIKDSISPTSFADVGSSSVISDGWIDEVGFLNNYSQRTHDGDYYQYFSYSLKSEVPFEKWNDAVSNLNHTLGFKKFSELNVLSSPEIPSDIPSEQNEGSFSAICQLNSTIDVDCIHDFDLVSENNFYIDETLTSDEMVFNSTILIDYFESIGNRVLTIDDISNEFTNLVSKTYVTSFTI